MTWTTARSADLVSVAGGLALSGMRPIAHTYTPFLIERPFEQVKLDLTHQGLGAVLVSTGASYDASDSGRTHHAPEDVALLDTLPDWTIHVPGHEDEVEALLRTAVAGHGSVYIRLDGASNHVAHADGRRMVVVRRGGGPTIVAVGPMLSRVLEATEDLDVTVLYAATIRPFDGDTLRAIAGTPEVILVEPTLAGTSARSVTEALRDRPTRILSVGVERRELRRYGQPWEHARAHGLDPAGIRASIEAFLAG